MAQNRPRPGVETQQINNGMIAAAKEQPHQPYRRHTFQAVPGKDYESRLSAQHPQCVGGAGIAAAVLADVYSMGLSIEIAGLKQAENISDQQTYYPNHDSFSFRSLMMNRRGVPRKPKVSLIWFSIYLV